MRFPIRSKPLTPSPRPAVASSPSTSSPGATPLPGAARAAGARARQDAFEGEGAQHGVRRLIEILQRLGREIAARDTSGEKGSPSSAGPSAENNDGTHVIR